MATAVAALDEEFARSGRQSILAIRQALLDLSARMSRLEAQIDGLGPR